MASGNRMSGRNGRNGNSSGRRPTRQATARMAKLWDRLPARLVEHVADTWERLIPHIPEFKWHESEDEQRRASFCTKGDRIATLIPLLATLEHFDLALLHQAIVQAMIDGPLSGKVRRNDLELVEMATRRAERR